MTDDEDRKICIVYGSLLYYLPLAFKTCCIFVKTKSIIRYLLHGTPTVFSLAKVSGKITQQLA
jgi:hypothetical protein